MFNVLRQAIKRQSNKFKKEFQEIIRPVVDDAVQNTFRRYQQGGAVGNNFPNSSNPNLLNSLNNLLGRHQYIINAGFSTLTLLVSLAGVSFAQDALQVQQEANRLAERVIESNNEVVESNREVVDALNRSINSRESSGSYFRIFRAIGDLFHIGRSLFDLKRYLANRSGHPSGRRNSNDSSFDTPPSGRAFREGQNRRGRSI